MSYYRFVNQTGVFASLAILLCVVNIFHFIQFEKRPAFAITREANDAVIAYDGDGIPGFQSNWATMEQFVSRDTIARETDIAFFQVRSSDTGNEYIGPALIELDNEKTFGDYLRLLDYLYSQRICTFVVRNESIKTANESFPVLRLTRINGEDYFYCDAF